MCLISLSLHFTSADTLFTSNLLKEFLLHIAFINHMKPTRIIKVIVALTVRTIIHHTTFNSLNSPELLLKEIPRGIGSLMMALFRSFQLHNSSLLPFLSPHKKNLTSSTTVTGCGRTAQKNFVTKKRKELLKTKIKPQNKLRKMSIIFFK